MRSARSTWERRRAAPTVPPRPPRRYPEVGRTRSVANVARAPAENAFPPERFWFRKVRFSAASINARSAAAPLSASFAAGTFAPDAAKRASAPAMRRTRSGFPSFPPFSSVSPFNPKPAAASETLEMTSEHAWARRSETWRTRESIRKMRPAGRRRRRPRRSSRSERISRTTASSPSRRPRRLPPKGVLQVPPCRERRRSSPSPRRPELGW